MAILTLSRQIASLGDEVASTLASRLGWELITRDTILNQYLKPIATPREFHLLRESSKLFLEKSENTQMCFLEYAEKELEKRIASESVVMVGFGSQVIFANEPDSLHVRVIAPESVRRDRIRRQYNVSEEDSMRILTTADRKHRRFVSTVFGIDLTDPDLYDLTLNTAHLNVDTCVAAVLGIMQEKKQQKEMAKSTEDTDVIYHDAERHDFKHPAEIEFARILDMYQIEWKYEPKTFPFEWDAEGNVTLAFSPDFYLPQFDTYLELTTMNQKYVTMKNRKARKVRELYPGTNVKIVYKKDFQSLVERFSGQGG